MTSVHIVLLQQLCFINIYLCLVADLRVDHTGGCPDGWQTYLSNCYQLNMNAKNQSAARTDCQSQGAELTSITDEFEFDFIKSLV